MKPTGVGCGFFLIFNVLLVAFSSNSFAEEPTQVRCKGQVRRQYMDALNVKDSIGLPVAVVGSTTFQEDLKRIAVSDTGEVVELSLEDFWQKGSVIELKHSLNLDFSASAIHRGRGSLHFDGGYVARIIIMKNRSTSSNLIVEVSLRRDRGDTHEVLGSGTMDLRFGQGYVTVENKSALKWVDWMASVDPAYEMRALHELVSAGFLEDGVVTLAEVDCQVIHPNKFQKSRGK